MRSFAVLPVKSFPRAKQRLGTSVDPKLRRQLAQAMLCDVLDALAATSLDGVILVTSGEAPTALARQRGVHVVADRDQGHNAAATLGVQEAQRLGAERALLVPGDCPALEAGEVDDLLERPSAGPSVIIVPDRHGTGTNALLITPPDALKPSFGPGSCQRHAKLAEAAGIPYDVIRVPSLALDIDTPDDLDALAALPDRPTHTSGLLLRC